MYTNTNKRDDSDVLQGGTGRCTHTHMKDVKQRLGGGRGAQMMQRLGRWWRHSVMEAHSVTKAQKRVEVHNNTQAKQRGVMHKDEEVHHGQGNAPFWPTCPYTL